MAHFDVIIAAVNVGQRDQMSWWENRTKCRATHFCKNQNVHFTVKSC
jgi:hypothetical protein